MTAATWPTWLAWLLAIAILLTLFFVWTLVGQLTRVQEALRGGQFRTRRELEEAYTAGNINRDVYERLKGRMG